MQAFQIASEGNFRSFWHRVDFLISSYTMISSSKQLLHACINIWLLDKRLCRPDSEKWPWTCNVCTVTVVKLCWHNFTQKCIFHYFFVSSISHRPTHGLRTPNKGINQRYLKNWADVTDKICYSLKIWEWELTFGRAMKAISSLGVRTPCI